MADSTPKDIDQHQCGADVFACCSHVLKPARGIQPFNLHQNPSGRSVPSPRPMQVLEIGEILRLVVSGTVTICAGSGSIPVMQDSAGNFSGTEAITDKNHASRIMACETQADALLLLTDVNGLYLGWARRIARSRGEQQRMNSSATVSRVE